MNSEELMEDMTVIVDDWSSWKLKSDDAVKRIMELFERAGEKARSTELLASSEADGHGKNETGKASSDVGQFRCPWCGVPPEKHTQDEWNQCCDNIMQRGTGKRSSGRAERLANGKLTGE